MSQTIQITGRKGLSTLAVPRALAIWETELAPIVLAEIKHRAPVGQDSGAGRLRDSISIERRAAGGGVSVRFVSSVPYATFVENGTGPHRIEPRNARVLHWTSGGSSAFAHGVNHPGTRPNPFARKAIESLMPLLSQRLRADITKELEL